MKYFFYEDIIKGKKINVLSNRIIFVELIFEVLYYNLL